MSAIAPDIVHAPREPLDQTDRALISATQGGLPLTARPYLALAQEIGTTEEDVLRRFEHLLQLGIVRRIGAVPNHYKLGYHANGMSVWDVQDDLVAMLGRRVGALDFVSHCYHRPRHLPVWPYNLFAMVHGRTRDEVASQAAEIATLLGDADRGHDILYSSRILKKTGLRLTG